MPLDITALFVAVPIVGLTVLFIYFLCREWAEEAGEAIDADTESSTVEKAFTAATWLLALVYIVMGVPKLGTLSGVVHQFEHWGYSPTFMYVIGGIEFLGAIVILLPRIRLFAVAGLAAIMAGAIYTHLAFDPAWYIALPTTCLALLLFVGHQSWRREWQEADDFREAAGGSQPA